ncbi:MAG TPA: transglycosylase domain-containing protein, partial [Xanthobacteraceae bacterium]
MAWREGRKRGGASLDELSPEDRIGTPSEAPINPNKSPTKPAASPSRRRRRSRDEPSPRKRKRGGKRRVLLRRALYWGTVLALWALIAGIGVLAWIFIHLPPIQSLEIPKRPPSVLILGDNGATLATRGDMGGAAVPIGELPDYAPNAFIAIEDRRFYSHRGVDPLGITRALVADVLRRGTAQG